MAIPYLFPNRWIIYDLGTIFDSLVNAKASIKALRTTPYQKDWVDELQAIQLKMEVAGTSRIEGAEFTDRELDSAMKDDGEQLFTRSQRQAKAAATTYRYIAKLPDDRPINAELICEIHRRLVTGCDEDKCAPGVLRRADHNVTFGTPPHRGAAGGAECAHVFAEFCKMLSTELPKHDPLIQAVVFHYHFAAIHPFGDGNGRTARAVEALILQRAGLRDTAFIAMSNYYYEEKDRYLEILAKARHAKHDLTEFLSFALRGVDIQCNRLLIGIKENIQKAMFRNTMYDLFNRLQSPKKRVIAQRQIEILKFLLAEGEVSIGVLRIRLDSSYGKVHDGRRAIIRDLDGLLHLEAIIHRRDSEAKVSYLKVNLEWPASIREGEFFERYSNLPKAKTSGFLT